MADATITRYETTFILGEDATPEQAKSVLADLTTFIEKLDGKVSKHEFWGKRDLAYSIKGNRVGFYVTFWFDFPGNHVGALEKELGFNEQIIRSLVTKAYTTAQPGSLYPVAEEEQEKPSKAKRAADKEESATAEAELRMTSKTAKPAKAKKKTEEKTETAAEEESEQERLKKLDEALGDILKDEE